MAAALPGPGGVGRGAARERELTATESAVCGGLAGLASRVVIAPLDVVKIRLQA